LTLLAGLGLVRVAPVLEIPAAAQSPGVERTYSQPKAQIDGALDKIRASMSGKLPILDGFVEATDQPLERYQNGYYQCSVLAVPVASGGTLVRVVAKVTAWYSDPDPARSGYRTLPSNGRLEGDLLDRLAGIVGRGSGDATRAAPSLTPPSLQFPQTPRIRPSAPRALPPTNPASQGLEAPAASTPAASMQPGVEAGPEANRSGIAPVALERERMEKHLKELGTLAHNLEEILHDQAHPNDLAAVKKSRTPIYAKPQPTAAVLFFAEAQDEFPILGVQPAWVRVQISGASRGWIRREQLELPEGFAKTPGDGGDTNAVAGVTFHVTGEAIRTFAGSWQPLRGKPVKVISVAPPAGQASSPREKREFAKSLLVAAYPKVATSGVPVEGIVVVFDSADGGQIAVTLADLKRLQEGRLSVAAFWQQCSLDPPEAFRDVSKP
jgi:hypothetical protein